MGSESPASFQMPKVMAGSIGGSGGRQLAKDLTMVRLPGSVAQEPILITLPIAAGCKVRQQRCRAKIILNSFDYTCGDFAPAALPSGFSLGLIYDKLSG